MLQHGICSLELIADVVVEPDGKGQGHSYREHSQHLPAGGQEIGGGTDGHVRHRLDLGSEDDEVRPTGH